ncbi:MAG TPA: flavodoxin domain-containing protein [Dehalococcoidales bacterium]|nr:flavodoxin domain-containing protein [Dehalococcoidales bacterium]
MKALIVYWSATGNTELVAKTIHDTLVKRNIDNKMMKVADANDADFYDYDLVFFGAPPYQFTVPDPVMKFIKAKMKFHADRGDIKPTAPKLPGKNAVMFCTYSGPHTGIREAKPALKYLGQFFEHIGFTVIAEWYIIGEFHNNEIYNTQGVLGDIRGRPNKKDLAIVTRNTGRLINRLLI